MRATTHNGRANKNGAYRASHNDRKFNLDKAEHIDQDKTKKNLYWHYLQTEPGIDFTEAERRFYESHFSAGLQAKNASYQKHGNKKCIQTMDEYRTNPRSCPEEQILVIGKKGNTVSPNVLRNICEEQFKWEQENFPSVKILDYCVHVDEEGAPHVHKRQVYIGHNKQGHEIVGQNKALEEMGIKRPDTTRPAGRYNNAKQTYTQACRLHFFEICRRHGLEMEDKPQERSKTGKSIEEYQASQEEQKAQNLIRLQEHLKAENQALQENLEDIKADVLEERFDLYNQRTNAREIQQELNNAINNKRTEYERLTQSVIDLKRQEQESKKRLQRVKGYLTKAEQRELQELYKEPQLSR